MKSLYESILGSTNAGRESLIRAWLDEHNIKNYTINSKGEIDVNGRVDLRVYDFEVFPSYIQFGTVKGDFYWHDKIASLKGAHRKVEKSFFCDYANVTTLEGAPKEVGGSFYCRYNHLTTLEGSPMKVGGGFYCWKNQLKSLKGAPREVVGRFDCSDNNLTSLKGAPLKVNEFDCRNNDIQFSKDDVIKVCKVKLEKNIYV